jgi:hypothetical protein
LTTKDKTVCASNSNVEKPVASGIDLVKEKDCRRYLIT